MGYNFGENVESFVRSWRVIAFSILVEPRQGLEHVHGTIVWFRGLYAWALDHFLVIFRKPDVDGLYARQAVLSPLGPLDALDFAYRPGEGGFPGKQDISLSSPVEVY